MLNQIRKALDRIEDPDARARVAGAPKLRGSHWVRPELVAQVTYKDITGDGMIRHGSFMRLRDDKRPEECRAEAEELAADPADDEEGAPLPEPAVEKAPDRTIKLTNLDKVFWPEEGYTKGDLIQYYRTISPWLLPYLADRPVVLTRYPDGIEGKSFYQKDAPGWTPDWIRTVAVEHEGGEKMVNYFVAEDLDTLTYIANLGSIPLHIWHSRASSLAHPDWCLLDLDPKAAPFAHVVEIALFLHDLCEGLELPHYVKTSGSSGLHVLIPLGGRMGYDQSVTLGELIARTVVRKLPKISTIERTVKKRGGKVYVDYLQNRGGQLMAAPFSVREKPGATVSAPLLWKEVGKDLAIADYTIETMPPRMKKLKKDPLAAVLEESPDLLGALERLMAKVG
jgi:bifunctional non-homologous end joining protein LigD